MVSILHPYQTGEPTPTKTRDLYLKVTYRSEYPTTTRDGPCGSGTLSLNQGKSSLEVVLALVRVSPTNTLLGDRLATNTLSGIEGKNRIGISFWPRQRKLGLHFFTLCW